MKPLTIAIIGCGNMGSSLLAGLLGAGWPPENIWVTSTTEESLKRFSHMHVNVTIDNQKASAVADVILFAVKPNVLARVAKSLASTIQAKSSLIISVVAGIRETSLRNFLGGGHTAIVRCMPNIPAMIGCGASALYANGWVTTEQKNTAELLLRTVGSVVWIEEESWMDIVTALSGSGPAYFFLIIEILQKAGEALGLPHDVARLLTLQTAYGASRMALESSEEVEYLRKRVTSAGGTTEKAILCLEAADLRKAFQDALQAAKIHSEQLEKSVAGHE